ncbi:MAG: restriction endonuclease subunit S [Chitinophagaceae bacterium]|nr:restriction endonuclease subunit S [Anaerolineae bacterium]
MVLSAEWPSVPISELCELIIDCVNKTAKVVDGPTPYKMIRTTNVRDGWVDTINVRYVEEDTYKKWTRRGEPRNGDVILTREAPLGEVGLLRDARGIFLGQRLVMYRANPTKLDNRFLLYSLLGHDLQAQIRAFGSGSTVEHMRVPDCEKLILQLPPLETQQKIGSILSAYDDLIENNTRRIKILEEMARMIYSEWFVNFRFPGHEKVKMIDSPLGKIPEGWEVVTVEQVIRRMSAGKKYDNKTVSPTGTVPVLDQGKSGIIGYHNDEPGVIASEEDPIIVFANHTCYQHLIQFPFSAIQNVLPFLPSKENQRNIYWLHWATKDLIQFNDYKGHWPEFSSKELLLPDTKTCDSFGAFMRPIVKFIYKIELKNQNLRQTRDLLLPKLVAE